MQFIARFVIRYLELSELILNLIMMNLQSTKLDGQLFSLNFVLAEVLL